MIRFASLCFVLLPAFALAQDPPKIEKIEIGSFAGHFEKNTSGLTGDTSVLHFNDLDSFEKVFGMVPPAGVGRNPGRKAVPVTKETFEKSIVLAVIKRGKSVTTFSETTATLSGETLRLLFKSESGPATTANFASPLIVSIPRNKGNTIVYVENGKEIGSIK